MLAGISQILVIATPQDLPAFERLFGDGSQLGMQFSYAEQAKPAGIAEAFLIGRDFIGSDRVALVLGDNLFYGQGFRKTLVCAAQRPGATIFGYQVSDPERYGVVEFNEAGKVVSIEEKPQHPKSNYAIPGLYFYDNDVIDIAAQLQPSARGELEITDINRTYLERGELAVELFSRGFAWLDTGTKDSLLDASNFVAAIEKRQGLKIACLEEIAYLNHFIDADQLRHLANQYTNEYRPYLENLVDG